MTKRSRRRNFYKKRHVDHMMRCMAEAYKAVGAIMYEFDLFDSPDMVRLLDVLASEKTMDGIELLPFPREPLVPGGGQSKVGQAIIEFVTKGTINGHGP